jgi:uncharacterized protein YodC (DUF2158 family)
MAKTFKDGDEVRWKFDDRAPTMHVFGKANRAKEIRCGWFDGLVFHEHRFPASVLVEVTPQTAQRSPKD